MFNILLAIVSIVVMGAFGNVYESLDILFKTYIWILLTINFVVGGLVILLYLQNELSLELLGKLRPVFDKPLPIRIARFITSAAWLALLIAFSWDTLVVAYAIAWTIMFAAKCCYDFTIRELWEASYIKFIEEDE